MQVVAEKQKPAPHWETYVTLFEQLIYLVHSPGSGLIPSSKQVFSKKRNTELFSLILLGIGTYKVEIITIETIN